MRTAIKAKSASSSDRWLLRTVFMMPLLQDHIVDRLWTIVTDPGFPSRRGTVAFSAPGYERRGRGAYRRRGPALQRAND